MKSNMKYVWQFYVQVCFYKSLLVAITISFFAHKALYAQPTPPEGASWEVVPMLTDEFDYWDDTKWYKELWNYPAPVSMQAKNSGVTDGKLWIKATLGSDEERWFETCRVYSKTRIKFPMYTECRMRTSDISAFNTFWLNNGGGVTRDEIDICENVSNPSNPAFDDWSYTMHSQYFIVKDGVEERRQGNFDNRNLSDENAMKGVKWNEQFHTLGLWWKDKNNLQFYINGEEAGSVISTKDFTKSQNIIWDLWTSPESWFCGLPAKEDLNNDDINTMYIDWIHTYQLVEGPVAGILNNKGESSSVTIYPNPVSNRLNISTTNKGDSQLNIYDTAGVIKQMETIHFGKNSIDVSSLEAGSYIIIVSDIDDQKSVCLKFIKE